jgi:hypothetical protein
MEGFCQHSKELVRFTASHQYQRIYITCEMSPSPHNEEVNILTWNIPLSYAQSKLRLKTGNQHYVGMFCCTARYHQ